MTTTMNTEWLAVGQWVAVLANHHGQWLSIDERQIVAFGPAGAKDSAGETWKPKDIQSDGNIRVSESTMRQTWVVPAGGLFHRDAIVTMNSGEAMRDVDGARHVLRRTASAKSARSTADALEVAARRLRETADLLESAELHAPKEA